MANQSTTKFYGGVIKRVFVLYQKHCDNYHNQHTLKFIASNFNKTRNYREFTENTPVSIIECSSNKLPRLSSFKEGDACLILGCGRLIDKETYNFAKRCYEHNIPVYFIRSNSIISDNRCSGNPIWNSTSISVKTSSGTKFYRAPEKYFMEIPSIDDFILSNGVESYCALLPGMVPVDC